MMWVDTHAHISSTALADRQELINQILHEKIVIFDVGIDLASSRGILDFVRRHPRFYAVTGIHPYYASAGLDQFAEFSALVKQNTPLIKAIGEIGLDIKSSDLLAAQKKLFQRLLSLAQECALPVVIHSRGCFLDVLSVLDSFPGLKVLFHCFSYSRAEMDIVLDRGYYVSFALNIFKNNQLDECVTAVPEGRILLETDCPYMYFNKRESTPLHIKEVFARVAALRRVSVEKLGECVLNNTVTFFNISREDVL